MPKIAPPRRAPWKVDPNRPLTKRAKNKLHKRPKGFCGDPNMRRPDRVPVSGSVRRAAMPILFGSEQNAYVVGAHTLSHPPKGDPGCTVKTLDYRTPKSPERNGTGDTF